MLCDNRNYKYYDCFVKSYVWEEDKNIIILSCQYLDRGVTRIALREVCDSEYLEVLVNHVIDYVEYSYPPSARRRNTPAPADSSVWSGFCQSPGCNHGGYAVPRLRQHLRKPQSTFCHRF